MVSFDLDKKFVNLTSLFNWITVTDRYTDYLKKHQKHGLLKSGKADWLFLNFEATLCKAD